MRSALLSLLVISLAAGCGDKDTGSAGTPDDGDGCEEIVDGDCDGIPDVDDCEPDEEGGPDRTIDADCDGYVEDDCDPNDTYTNPGMPEVPYDGRDNDCGGDGDLVDVDEDGYIGESAGGDDCNDANPDSHPGSEEVCYDAIDDNCDGVADGYKDNDCDHDGYEDRGENQTDCDPTDAAINPGADEIWYDGIDQDCDETNEYDADDDGANNSLYGGSDCDDTNSAVNPNNPELWDGLDNNCDTTQDDLDTVDARVTWEGTLDSDDGRFGASMDALDDLDGDGYREVLVGGPGSDGDAGWAHAMSPGEGSGVPADLAIATIAGGEGDELGWDLAVPGDLDGDGLADAAVGAPGEDEVYLFAASALAAGGTLDAADAFATIEGEESFGADVTLLGDLDGDGWPELAAGGGSFDRGTPTWVGVWDGEELGEGGNLDDNDAIALITGEGQGGESAGGADLDGDGLPDLVVATDTSGAGRVAVLLGADLVVGGELFISDLPQITGPSGVRGAVHGGVLADMDGDGRGELVWSSPDADTAEDGAGIVYVVAGQTAVGTSGAVADLALLRIEGEQEFGAMIALDRGGDFDGDGLSDLVVSAIGDSEATIVSSAFAFYGASLSSGGAAWQTSDADASFESGNTQDFTGWSGLAFDLEGDGDDDLLLGAPNGGVGVGYGYLYESLLVE